MKAGGQDRLAVRRGVEAELQHHRVHHGDRGRGQSHAGQPAWADIPAEEVAGHCGCAEERCEEAGQADDGGLLPLESEDARVQLGAGQEREHDGAGPGQKGHPGAGGSKGIGTDDDSDDQLGHRADHDLRQRRGDLEPDREQGGNQRESDPHRGQEPDVFHSRLLAIAERFESGSDGPDGGEPRLDVRRARGADLPRVFPRTLGAR